MLAKRHEELESKARKEAERALAEAAREAGIVERARKSARRTLEALMRSLGYEDVSIEWRDE